MLLAGMMNANDSVLFLFVVFHVLLTLMANSLVYNFSTFDVRLLVRNDRNDSSRHIFSFLPRLRRPTDTLKLSTDKPCLLTEESLLKQVERRLPNLPSSYLEQYKNRSIAAAPANIKCAKFPDLYDLEYNNLYWQTLTTSSGTFHLYGAYYDMRCQGGAGPFVRLLGVLNRLLTVNAMPETYCQIWYPEMQRPVIVRTVEYNYVWHRQWADYIRSSSKPYLISCPIPDAYTHSVPASVSLVENICDSATNNLKVTYNPPAADYGKKKNFAVCVKGLDFPYEDWSVRLIEWIELVLELGANKIFFYRLNVHPNISKVLTHYERQGVIEVINLTLPGGQPNMPELQHLYLRRRLQRKRQNELIPYNDCLYRNLYRFHYITLLDVDEVIVPSKAYDWFELMESINRTAATVATNKSSSGTVVSYSVRNVYFPDEFVHPGRRYFRSVPSYMHIFQHVFRKEFSKPHRSVKCFHRPEYVLTLHNHYPLECLTDRCKVHEINVDTARLQHYRKNFDSNSTRYKRYHYDPTVWKYKDQVVAKTQNTLRQLGFVV